MNILRNQRQKADAIDIEEFQKYWNEKKTQISAILKFILKWTSSFETTFKFIDTEAFTRNRTWNFDQIKLFFQDH